MSERLLVAGGLEIVTNARMDVLIENGKIKEIGNGLGKRRELKGIKKIDANQAWITPGLIDMHVHLREPGRESEETIATGTRAAAAGGFTTVLAMPNTQPTPDSPALIRFLRAKAEKDSPITVLFAGATTVGQNGKRLSEIGRLARAGAPAVSDDGKPVSDAGLMRRALEACAGAGILLIEHCEDLGLSAGGALHEGRTAARLAVRGIPGEAESAPAARAVELARLTGARLHLAHVSSARTVELVRRAKAEGLAVSCEATPHHLALCDSDIPRAGNQADFKMNPPLRSSADRAAILKGLADGTIDAIATDHAPHSAAKKSLGLADAPFGVIGLETALAVVLTKLLGKVLTPKQIVERMSSGPARLLGLKTKGSLQPGMDADIAVIDPAEAWTVAPPFLSKSANSPFVGMRLKGKVRTTISGGRIVHAL